MKLLVLLLLIEMMGAIGLRVSLKDLTGVINDIRLIFRAALVNYFSVPAIATMLLYLIRAAPMVTVGFLLVAVCLLFPL